MSKINISTVFLGAPQDTSSPSDALVLKTLKTLLADKVITIDTYVLAGQDGSFAKRIIPIAHKLKLRVLQSPAECVGRKVTPSALQMCNATLLQQFKPDAVILFAEKSDFEDDTTLAHLKKLAFKSGAFFKVVGKKK